MTDKPEVKSNKTVAQELEDAIKILTETDKAEISPEKILELRKTLNPYGRTIEGSDRYMNFSITLIETEWWKKFLTTGMIAFLNRGCDEYLVPDGMAVHSVYDCIDDPSLLDTPELVANGKDEKIKTLYQENRESFKKRLVIKEFLEYMFQFNPDEHVRSAYKPNPEDGERKPVRSMAAKLATEHLKRTSKEYKNSALRAEDTKTTIDYTPEPKKKTKKVIKYITDQDGKKKKTVVEVPLGDKKIIDSKGFDETVQNTTREFIPSHDMFGKFKSYYENHFEELKEATIDLYCEKPYLEYAVNPYSWHDSAEQAEAFKQKHRDEVISNVYTARSGMWNVFTCYKDQRENTSFYNSQTSVIEEILKQTELDAKLGADMVKNTVVKKKKQNEIEVGPDAPTFQKWKRESSTIRNAEKPIGHISSDDIPDDAVEVPVWRLAKSGTQLVRDRIFTKAGAPTVAKE